MICRHQLLHSGINTSEHAKKCTNDPVLRFTYKKLAKKLCNMLEPFYNATNVASGSKYPTSDCYFHMLWEVKKELDRQSSNADLIIATMVDGMRGKLNKY